MHSLSKTKRDHKFNYLQAELSLGGFGLCKDCFGWLVIFSATFNTFVWFVPSGSLAIF